MATDVEITAHLNPEGTIRGLIDIEDQAAEASKEVQKLNARYQVLKDTLDNTDTKSKDWNKLYKEVRIAEKALNEANQELEDLETNGRVAAGSIADLERQLEALNGEISTVAVGSAEFEQLSAQIRNLDGQLATANESLMGLSAEDKASRIGQLAGGLGNVAAAAALIGGEDSAIGEFFGGIQGAIGIMVGVQGAIEAVAASKKLLGALSAKNAVTQTAENAALITGTAATTANTTATVAQTAATGAQTAATGAATTASWALNASLLANPVFWIVAAIMAVVAAFAIFAASTKTAAAEHDKLNASLEKQTQLIEANRKVRERANSELENEVANREKLIRAEIALLEATGNRSKEQEKRLRELGAELDNIDEKNLEILGTETRKKIDENTRLLHDQIVAAKKGIDAVWQEDWGVADFDYDQVKGYFDEINRMQQESAELYRLSNEAQTEQERLEYIKRAQDIEDTVTQKTSRVLTRLESIKGTLGGDASEQMQKVIDDITKFGERANESAELMSNFQKSIDNFNTNNIVAELEKQQKAEQVAEEQRKKADEEAEKRREKAREDWKKFISEQKALREELAIARMTDQEKEIYDLQKWFDEKSKLTQKDADLSLQLNEEFSKRNQAITDKYNEIALQKEKDNAAALIEIQRQLFEDSSLIESMKLSASVAMAQEESDLLLEQWQKSLDSNKAITDQELENLVAHFSARKNALISSIDQEADYRKKVAENEKNDEIAEAENRIKKLQENGLDEIQAQQQLAELKLSALAKYNATVTDIETTSSAERRAAQKEFDDAQLQAQQEQYDKLVALNQMHNDKLIEGFQMISAALNDSVGQFEGAIGKLGATLSVGVANLSTAVLGFSEQVKEIKAKTKEGVVLTPEEEQALKESTSMAVASIVGAAGSVAQGIVDTIFESNRQKTEEALNELELNKQRELDIIQRSLDAGTINQETADKQRKALDLKAAQEKYKIEEEAFENEKKAKIATATIAGITGAVSAFAGAMQLGPIAGPIVGALLAAAVGTMTGINIANIKKTKFGGTPPQASTSGISSGAAGSVPQAVDPSTFMSTGGESGNEPGTNQTGENSSSGNQQIIVKAFVTETDVTSTQKQVAAIEDRSEFN